MRARWSLEPRQGTSRKRRQAGTDVQNRRKTGSQNNKSGSRTVAVGVQPIVSAGIAAPRRTAAGQRKKRENSGGNELKLYGPGGRGARTRGAFLHQLL